MRLTALAFIVLLSASSTGCDSAITATDTRGGTVPAPTLAEPLPSTLQATLDTSREALGFPGAMVGVWTPEGSWFGVTGVAGRGSDRPPRREDHTRIGSLTKTFTVMALLQLVDQKKVSLQDTIGAYVPGMPNGDTATLRDLARMTSGIVSYTETDGFLRAWSADPAGAVFTPPQLIDFARAEPPLFPAGTQMNYSNTNTVLLGMVIEKVTGKPVAEVFSTNIFGPLGMSATSFPGTSPALPLPHLDGITIQPEGPGGPIRDATDWNPSWTFTAGGMISALDDMRTWTEALGTGGGLISETMQREREASATSTTPPNTPELTYGLGFFCDRGWWGHNGALPGFTTYAVYQPERRISVVVFVNSDITTPDQPTAPADLLAEDIIGTVTG